jgi:nucleoside-diphosphate-sugar epimerase
MIPTDEHILLLGGTGATGLVFLKHITTLPPTSRPKVTTYVRNRSRLPPNIEADPSIDIVEGALNDAKALNTAMKGVTTVISFLGAYVSLYHAVTRTTPTPIADSFPAIFDAMRTNGVRRIMVLSTPSAFPQPSEVLSWKWWIITSVLPSVLVPQGKAEMKGIAERTSDQRDFDWTVFRVPHLNDQEEDVEVVAGLIGSDYRGTTELSRKSLVKWVLGEVGERKWVGNAPMLGNC